MKKISRSSKKKKSKSSTTYNQGLKSQTEECDASQKNSLSLKNNCKHPGMNSLSSETVPSGSDDRPNSCQRNNETSCEGTGNQQAAIKWLDEWHKNNDRADSSQRKNKPYNEGAFTTDKQKNGLRKIFDQNHEQFIKGAWKNGCLVKLHYAQFKTGKSDYLRVYALDNLYTGSKNNFVARIKIHPLRIPSGNFQNIRKEIESKIVIIKILDDDLKNKLETSREQFKSILKSKQETVTVARVAQRDMFQLFLLIKELSHIYKYGYENENIALLHEIIKNKRFSEELLNGARAVYEDEKNYSNRNAHFPIINQIKNKFGWISYISECVKSSIASLKTALVNALPPQAFIPSGPADINLLPDRQLFTCSVRDIHLFSDLELSIRQHEKTSELVNTKFHDFIQSYINKLWKSFITKVNTVLLNNIPDTTVYTNTVFLQLFKTFLELLNFVCGAQNEEILKVVTINDDADINIVENTPGIYEKRLQFVMSLLNHFKPGNVKKCAFNYNFFFFKTNETIFKRFTGFFVNMLDTSLSDIPQEYVIWIYYIHKSFADLFYYDHEESDKSELYSFLNSLMDLCINAIRNNTVSLEKVRILANSLIKFGSTMSPYFLDQTSVNENDLSLLLQQAEYLKQFVTAYDQTVNDITNIVDIYQVFWDERRTLFTELRRKYSLWPTAVDELSGKFNTLIRYIFNLKIYNNKFISLLRSYNEFMRLLRGTDFPWYVEKQNICSESFVKLVEENSNSYLIEDVAHFIQEYLDNSRNLPQHFLFDLAKNFINCVEEFLSQSDWETSDKINAASDLLLLMGRSLINFNKLPHAVDFQHFYALFTDPFKRVTQNSTDINDFKRRLGSLENYYKYTMELNVMSVAKALELCKQNITGTSMIDYTFNFDQLNLCYEMYLDKFNNYVEKYILETDFNVYEFAKKICSKAKRLDISKWDSQYKVLKLPKLLAGLSAVWSALESKDVISQKQVIKPHCIQILCVLRLLSADQPHCGVDSHLAQVLTGQGKSIVLSLLAAILALTGNRVRIVCYNTYLAMRDQAEFQMFYETLNIQDQINYGTFEDMANEILNPDINGTKYCLRTFVKNIIIGDLLQVQFTDKDDEVTRTVLLIDEVDVFFSPEFYGNIYRGATVIGSETIAEIQLKIWNLITNNHNVSDIKEKIQKFIDEIFPQSTDDTFVKIMRNSRNLLNCHIEQMISTARIIQNSSAGDTISNKFKLRNDGLISFIATNGEHRTTIINYYENVFMYLKLKSTNFQHMDFQNYGYLLFNSGDVSYALLPKNYNSILGVTGTLKQLTDVEMRAVTSYNIARGSDMPTFFGNSKLRVTNFTVKDSETEWMKVILDSILCVVEQGRAVIVFFADEHTINSVRGKFASHLSRYSVLTGNESEAEVASCVEEAGVARKVTIATRRMGRGVDFKSNDSAVESKGGVHVIQTFWSEDVKEETQIKGRTARKDNNGSYEAILCREHLTEAGYEATACSYNQLSEARNLRVQNKGTELAQSIVESQQKHDATMKFFKSLINYNPDNRQEYLEKYPFVKP